MVLLQQMLALFTLMLLGYLCARMDVLDKVTTKKISWLVVNVANVAMILQAGLNNQNGIPRENILFVGGVTIGIYAVLLLLAVFVPGILRVEKENYGVYRTMFIFSNCGFMGMPLLYAISGAEAVLYAAIFQFPFNTLIYTYGISMMQKSDAQKEKFNWRNLLNIGVLSCVLALIFFFGEVDMPNFIDTILENLSNLTAPLSMLVIGQSFTQFRLKELVTDVRLLLFSAIKLLIVPVIGMTVLKQFIWDTTILTTCLVMISTPVGSMTAMLAQQYDGNYELAARGVALTTILSCITIPIVSAIVGI